jgi:hypothetical protein
VSPAGVVSPPAKWPCRVCGGRRTPEGYDPCVGWLAGAQHVCCGHGLDADTTNRYVITDNGRIFRGFGAFQTWRHWAGSPEGRAVIGTIEHSRRFGWLGWHAGRQTCSTCRIPHYECTCGPPIPGHYGNRGTRPPGPHETR